MSAQLPAGVCARCDGEGYVCIMCELAPTACECYDDFDENDGDIPDIEVKRCSCNPRPKHLKR
jgi:hypothetical protein